LKFLKSTTRALGLTVTAVVAAAEAADPGVIPPESSLALSVQSPPPPPIFFWQRFDFAFDDRANGIFADALQPLNAIRWNVDLRGRDFSDNFRELAARRASGAMMKSIEYGTREAAVELPFMVWLDDHEGWFANLLRDSVDNVTEETASPLDPARESVLQSWWRNEARNGTHYGLRPLRGSPYAYLSHGISDGERTILLAHARYYYDRFANHRFELAFSVPLDYGMTFDIGSAYQFGTHDQERFVVKLVRELKGGGIAHVGFEVRQHPELIAGITFTW
jgi:hypothetical protein